MTTLWYDYYPVLNWDTTTIPNYLQAPRCWCEYDPYQLFVE